MDNNKLEIVVYKITGRQLFLNIPHEMCEECDITVEMLKNLAKEYPNIDLKVKQWTRYFYEPLLKGGWHTPIVMINGKIYSQGVVPDHDQIKKHIESYFQKA